MILNDIYPKSPFILKLTNLKHLKLFKCSNIYFIENNFLKLKYLCLMSNHLTYKENELLKFPELNTLISDYEGSNYDSIMDLANLKNLKIFKGKSEHFLSLNNSESLEKLIIYSFGKQELKKIISLKALQEIEINEIFDNQLEYYGKNPSVKKLKICCCKSRGNFNLLYFLENFPNLNDLTIDINCIEPLFTCEWESHSKKYDEQIIIKEDSKSMINKILINLKSEGYVIKFNCAPYQNLEYIDLIIDRLDINNLPFFLNKCDNISFDSLKFFSFEAVSITEEIMDNLYYNIDKMPNLIDFQLVCHHRLYKAEIYYKSFIKKVLSLKFIQSLVFNIWCTSHQLFSKSHIVELFPEINFKLYKKIIIGFDGCI